MGYFALLFKVVVTTLGSGQCQSDEEVVVVKDVEVLSMLTGVMLQCRTPSSDR